MQGINLVAVYVAGSPARDRAGRNLSILVNGIAHLGMAALPPATIRASAPARCSSPFGAIAAALVPAAQHALASAIAVAGSAPPSSCRVRLNL